jgi:hypothetical protein
MLHCGAVVAGRVVTGLRDHVPPVGAGNFIYIAASDLIPPYVGGIALIVLTRMLLEVKHDQRLRNNLVHFAGKADSATAAVPILQEHMMRPWSDCMEVGSEQSMYRHLRRRRRCGL